MCWLAHVTCASLKKLHCTFHSLQLHDIAPDLARQFRRYTCDIKTFKGVIGAVKWSYGRPIWLTEFNCQNSDQPLSRQVGLHAGHAAYCIRCEFRGHRVPSLCASGMPAPHDEATQGQFCRPVPYDSSLLTAEEMLPMQPSTRI